MDDGPDRRPPAEPPSPPPARPEPPPPSRPASPVSRPDLPRPARPGTPRPPGRQTPPPPARPSSPPSARPQAPAPGGRPSSRTPAPSRRQKRSGAPAPASHASGSPPPPARLRPAGPAPQPPGRPGARPAGREDPPDEATLPPLPASTEWGFSDAGGAAWIARVAGTARSGVIADVGATLMLVRFFRAGDESEKPRGELVTVARDLAELFPTEWHALLAEAIRERPASGGARPKRRGRRRRRR